MFVYCTNKSVGDDMISELSLFIEQNRSNKYSSQNFSCFDLRSEYMYVPSTANQLFLLASSSYAIVCKLFIIYEKKQQKQEQKQNALVEMSFIAQVCTPFVIINFRSASIAKPSRHIAYSRFPSSNVRLV